ncbi:cob(I)yrinic acid a,c-diamide adenosyltransferase [Acidipropionibacterium virtanenii]|uniref:Corrinoid adenosyltransferase n=1 Tax=Acidipropionibacterium virtanenii TaxID=2057246 RepID=A0A344UTW3_9ACTN|nr:cob(I)yrinic acid a,c-diamide adenosyltransferase [Acidipropionibacterium virtanenii]AXE38711.1 Cob(I)yrinic acid a,c-diamide adenosyltransferase [Acidipropionibacterium virtanenii]
MVTLSRIYTRTGDHGTTRLVDNSVAAKSDVRVEAYGLTDAANAAIGLALALDHGEYLAPAVREALAVVQNELFDVGADLANPLVSNPKWEPLRTVQSSIDRLEHWCDEFGDPLPTLRSFILPGGNPVGAQLHVCRTAVRTAERAAWRAVEAYGTEISDDPDTTPGGVNELAITYLNRLSDLLFILSRAANRAEGDTSDEVLWVPGGERNAEHQRPHTKS